MLYYRRESPRTFVSKSLCVAGDARYCNMRDNVSEHSSITLQRLAVVAFLAIIAIAASLALSSPKSAPFLTNARPTPVSTPANQAAPLQGQAVPQIFANLTPDGAFDILIENNLYPDERTELATEIQQAFEYVSGRLGARASARFKAALAIDAQCGLHGITRVDERIAQVYSCNDIPRTRAVVIMAHELGHQLEYERYGQRQLEADQILSEGVATWAAGKYWLGGHADFRSYVREQRAAGALAPLATNVTREDFAAMNKLYYQWASFVEFLIDDKGGRERFDQLYITGHLSAGSANYVGVYGEDLNALERQWLAWLDS